MVLANVMLIGLHMITLFYGKSLEIMEETKTYVCNLWMELLQILVPGSSSVFIEA